LFIGVADKEREVVGVKNPLELEEKISSMIYDTITPMISPLFPKIDEIIAVLKSYVKRTSVLDGARRIEKTIIPEFALREIIIHPVRY